MEIKQYSRTRLSRRFSAVRLDLQASPRAVESADRLADMTRSQLINVVRDERAVVLPYTDGLHTYHLLFWPPCERFYVAEVPMEETAFEEGTPLIADVYTVTEFEGKGGEVSTRMRRMAADRALDKVAFRAWEEKSFGQHHPRKSVRVMTYLRSESDEPETHLFINAPVCQAYIDTWGLENAFGHPGFSDWYKRAADAAGIDFDRVIALRIAETNKVKLRLDAPNRECPHCTKSRRLAPRQSQRRIRRLMSLIVEFCKKVLG
ncbi:hypothetical protein [Paraburkholderia youngii]|uniref:hypothetical protein n=1 Tax=Paraburkholderia youngii TaxID=2782701 RepID=UPI003D1AD6CC